MTDFTPAATSALFPAYTGRVRTDPVDTASYGTAERKLALFHGEWRGSVEPVFCEFAY